MARVQSINVPSCACDNGVLSFKSSDHCDVQRGFQGDGVLLTSRDNVDDAKAAQDKHDVLYTFSRHLAIRRRGTRSSTLWSAGRAGIVSDAGQGVSSPLIP